MSRPSSSLPQIIRGRSFSNWIDYNGNRVADHQLSIDKNKFVRIEVDALRVAPESCLIYVNRDQPVTKHTMRVGLSLVPWENDDEYTRAHTRIGFVVEQAGQRFFTRPYAWPHQSQGPISIALDSCQTTSSWRSRPGPNESSSSFSFSFSSSSSFVFEPGTPLHFGFYLCYWPDSTAAAISCETLSSKQLLTFQFNFYLSVEDLQIDGWDVIREDRFDDRSRWLNWKGERLDRDYNMRSDSPQQFKIGAHCLASVPVLLCLLLLQIFSCWIDHHHHHQLGICKNKLLQLFKTYHTHTHMWVRGGTDSEGRGAGKKGKERGRRESRKDKWGKESKGCKERDRQGERQKRE